MSRTHRDSLRVKARQALNDWRESTKNKLGFGLPTLPSRYFHHWTSRYPHWWDTLFHHSPARRKNRDKLKKVATGQQEDDGNWADHKKPHKYYW